MFRLFRAIADRVKALLVANAGLDFEAQFASRNAERKAELLRQANDYENEGLTDIALELRQLAGDLSLKAPMASVLPSIEHWESHDLFSQQALTSATTNGKDHGQLALTNKKRK